MGSNCSRQPPNVVLSVCDSEAFQRVSLKPSDFEFQRIIGTGNYSDVRLARLHGQPVAVKVMNKAHLHREKQVKHVFAEKRVLRLLHCQFVVEFLGTCQDDIYLYCVLEYVAGGEFFSLLTRKNQLPKAEACFYIAEIVKAFCSLHAIGCLYRDLKPENILIAANGHLKLADLGFAKLLGRNERTYTMCGTPEYLAPELIDANGCGLELDWWQLGILLYEILAGKTPFMDVSPYRLYEKILMSSPDLTLSVFDESSRSLLKGLLMKLPELRLTQTQILEHPFFRQTNWENLLQATPPYVPQLVDPFDASCFEQFAGEQSKERLASCLEREFADY